MGYEPGVGLGKEGTGITAPIVPSTQKGHRGLGHFVEGFKTVSEEWKEREISTTVPLEWMSKPNVEFDEGYFKAPSIQLLIGQRKDTTADETT